MQSALGGFLHSSLLRVRVAVELPPDSAIIGYSEVEVHRSRTRLDWLLFLGVIS
jgi:hypothetical protein